MCKKNAEKLGESVRVLYVVGKVAPTAIALEVAHHMDCENIQLLVASFYETDYEDEALPRPLTRINAKGRFDLQGVWRLYRCIGDYKPDVIHVHHTVSAFWAALFGRLLGTKIIRSEHSNPQFHTPIQHAAKSITRGLSDLVLCNSRNTYRGIPDYQKSVLKDRCKIVYNGVDVDRIERASSIPPPFAVVDRSEVLTIGTVGRLIDEKNHKRLLQAFSQVIERFEGTVRLVIVGDGKNRSALKDQIDRLEVNEQVILTGEVEREKVYAALHAFDVFMMPSLSEGFCNAVVEAMAVGLPLLCSDIPTLREVVGDVAVYADPRDPSRMSKSLIDLLKQGREAWEERGTRARQLAVEEYSIDRTAREYTQAYFEV